MIYSFDTGCFIAMNNFYPDRFPSFWKNFNKLVKQKSIISTIETYREYNIDDFVKRWIENNKDIFRQPTEEDGNFIKKIYTVEHFKRNIDDKKLKRNLPYADPFIIAQAKTNNAKLVTLDKYKDNSANIPNICEHFNIPYTDLKGFIKEQNWVF